MNPVVLFAASLTAINPLEPGAGLGKTGGLILRDILLILGIGVLFLTLLVLWALRYARKRKHRRHHTTPGILANGREDSGASEHTSHRRRHHRRRRRHHHERAERNPTLAETGGLPPLRQEPPASPPA